MNAVFTRCDMFRFGRMNGREQAIEITSSDVQVWSLMLEVDDENLKAAMHCLSEDELGRAGRLVSDRHRREFITAHAALRGLLSRYCDRPPNALAFYKTPSGKPYLSDVNAIRFSLTHSHGRALIAVARDREVGIDLEKVRPEIDVVRLADRFLSSPDRAFIHGADPERRHERFLNTWVVREAVSKAEGSGLTFPLHRDHVEFVNRGQEARLIANGAHSDGRDLFVRMLSLEPDWIGAVAAQGRNWTVTYRLIGEL